MSNYNIEKTSGVTMGGLLLTMFIAFKLVNLINWSWWWVLAPLWLPVAIAFLIFLVLVIIKYIKS